MQWSKFAALAESSRVLVVGCLALIAIAFLPSCTSATADGVARPVTKATSARTPAGETGVAQAVPDDGLASRDPIPTPAPLATPIAIPTATPTGFPTAAAEDVADEIDGLVDPKAVTDRILLGDAGWVPESYGQLLEYPPISGGTLDELFGDTERRCSLVPAIYPRAPYSSVRNWDYGHVGDANRRRIQLVVASSVDQAHAQRRADLDEVWLHECSDNSLVYDNLVLSNEFFSQSFDVDHVYIEHFAAPELTEAQVADGRLQRRSQLVVNVRHGSLIAWAEIHDVPEDQISATLPFAADVIEQLVAAMAAENASDHRLPFVGLED